MRQALRESLQRVVSPLQGFFLLSIWDPRACARGDNVSSRWD
ncbi:hypothetical protein RISK_005380 [Rhodopirellula islandica]|uniref:Uncharacterized protein n=1 Tax=Rhodopirellula islandica TaxID=595434 RepID=A0A0J1EA09_RHOIS|nr:hypothetical protein RISK_005380 [Rhodopirellula islandica]